MAQQDAQRVRKTYLLAQSKDELRQILLRALDQYDAEIALISENFNRACPDDARACPHVTINAKTGERRALLASDEIQPCPSHACMIEQIGLWVAKFRRWLTNDKWAGSADASDALRAEETREIPISGYVDIILRAEMTLRDAIMGVARSVDALAHRWSLLLNKRTWIIITMITIAIVIIIMIIIVTLTYPRGKVKETVISKNIANHA